MNQAERQSCEVVYRMLARLKRFEAAAVVAQLIMDDKPVAALLKPITSQGVAFEQVADISGGSTHRV